MESQLKYMDGRSFGYHERNAKLGTINNTITPYLVTFISNNAGDKPIFEDLDGNKIEAKIGNVLDGMGILNTRDQRVELRSSDGMIFRLDKQSEFSIERTIEGIQPVYSGKVYLMSPSTFLKPPAKGKYPSSCYCFATNIFIEGLDNNRDAYYTLDFEALIYEYDEKGQKFSIFNQSPYTKTILKYRDNVPMRERYEVVEQRTLTNNEIDELVKKFTNPILWR